MQPSSVAAAVSRMSTSSARTVRSCRLRHYEVLLPLKLADRLGADPIRCRVLPTHTQDLGEAEQGPPAQVEEIGLSGDLDRLPTECLGLLGTALSRLQLRADRTPASLRFEVVRCGSPFA